MNQASSPKLVLAADIGGTNIRAAIINHSGKILQEKRQQANLSQADISKHDVITTLVDFFKPLIQANPEIKALGLGFPGFFIGHSGVLASSPNLPQLQQFKLSELLSKQLDLPVYAQNDALCAAIGEQRFGAAKNKANLLHITLGTGVGAGLILNHQPYTGEGGMAMEFGHLCVNYQDNAKLCGCSKHGCVEAYASALAIMKSYQEQGCTQLDTQAIYELACQSDRVAIHCLHEAGHYLGLAIAQAIQLLDIHTVSISGGLTGAWKYLHPSLMASMNQHLIKPLQGKVQVIPSSLNDLAGMLGAASLALE